MPQAMLKWKIDLNCGHTKEVWTVGDDPTEGRTDDWFCRECENARSAVEVIQIGWVIAPDLKHPDPT